MNPDQFIEQHYSRWQHLEALQQRARSTPEGMEPHEIDTLGRLYRMATADLALAQRAFPGHRVTAYLNQLVSRTYVTIYREQPPAWSALIDFYRNDFPRLYRALLPWTSVAFLLFAGAAIIAFSLVWQSPETLVVLQGEGIRPLMEQVQQGELWTEIAPAARSAAAGLILTNNIRVMFLTFAGGMTAGLLTLWVIISNGLSLGGVFGLLQLYGLSSGLADFVVAHGFVELGVIFLAGGCGLAVGDALIRPGLLSRRAALGQRARMGVKAILGSVPLLVLAGVIEGFVSPSALPFWAKLAVGLGTGAALHAYWLLVARNGEKPPPQTPSPSGQARNLP